MRSSGSSDLTGSHCRFHLFAFLIISAVVAAVYSNTLNAAFHLDDFQQIAGNPVLRSLDNIFYILTSQKRGVANATFALNYAFGGLDVRGYHIVNICIHILNATLVYFLLFFTISAIKKMRGRARRIALFSALLFAAHPIQIQAVTYITQRQESLSALFCLLALFFLVLAFRSSGRVKIYVFYALVPISYLLAFRSKEIAVTLPALVFLFDIYFAPAFGLVGKGGWLRRWPLHGAMGVLLAFFVLSSMSALGGVRGFKASAAVAVKGQAFSRPIISAAISTAQAATVKAKKSEQLPTAGFGVQGLSPKHYLLTELNVITYYMALLALPVNQNIDYDFPISNSLLSAPEVSDGTRLIYLIPPPIVSLLIIIAILIAAFYLFWRSAFIARVGEEESSKGAVSPRARSRIVSYFIFWFFIVLLPTSSFIPIIDVIFEHRLYLASLSFCVIVVLCIDWLSLYLFGKRGLNVA